MPTDWPAIQTALTETLNTAPNGSTVRVHPSLFLFARDHVETHGLTLQLVALIHSRDPGEVEVVSG